MNLFPNGIRDLVNAEKPKENEPQIILFFNAPLWFCNRYGVSQPQDSHHSKLNIIKEMQELFKLNIHLNLNLKKEKSEPNINFKTKKFSYNFSSTIQNWNFIDKKNYKNDEEIEEDNNINKNKKKKKKKMKELVKN